MKSCKQLRLLPSSRLKRFDELKNLHIPNRQDASSAMQRFSKVTGTPESSTVHTGPESMSQPLLKHGITPGMPRAGGAVATSVTDKPGDKKIIAATLNISAINLEQLQIDHHCSPRAYLNSANMRNLVILFIALGLLIVVSSQRSKQCPTACTYQYEPVCAKNSAGEERQFSNPCFLGVHNCPLPPNEHFQQTKYGPC